MEWMQSANAKLAKTSVSKVERTFCRTEKCDQRGGGEWEPFKIIAIESFGSRSKSTPQP